MSSTAIRVRFTERCRREAVQEAVDFLAEMYGLDTEQRAALAAVPILWRRRSRGSAFRFRRDGSPGRITVAIPRGSTATFHMYRRIRAGLVTPSDGIEMGLHAYARLVLVHEFTHALQHGACGGPRRKYSEVETTRNEIEFLRRRMPEVHARLVPVQRARSRRPEVNPPRRAPSLLRRLIRWLLGGPTSVPGPRSREDRVPRPARVG